MSEENDDGSFREDFARLAESHDRSTETFTESLKELSRGLEVLSRDTADRFERLIKESNQRFARLYERLDRDRKTPWAPVGIAASVLFSVGAIFGSNYTADQNELKADVKILEVTVVDRIKEAEYRRGLMDAFVDAQSVTHEQLITWNRRLADELERVKLQEAADAIRIQILMGERK